VITPIGGLYHPNAIGIHHNAAQMWLTSGKVGQSDKNTISVDQMVARITAPHTRISSLELTCEGHSLAVNADGIGLPADRNTGVALRRLFGGKKKKVPATKNRQYGKNAWVCCPDLVAGTCSPLTRGCR
jgi:hypothetical protein